MPDWGSPAQQMQCEVCTGRLPAELRCAGARAAAGRCRPHGARRAGSRPQGLCEGRHGHVRPCVPALCGAPPGSPPALPASLPAVAEGAVCSAGWWMPPVLLVCGGGQQQGSSCRADTHTLKAQSVCSNRRCWCLQTAPACSLAGASGAWRGMWCLCLLPHGQRASPCMLEHQPACQFTCTQGSTPCHLCPCHGSTHSQQLPPARGPPAGLDSQPQPPTQWVQARCRHAPGH